jgi:hypothetical protein
MCQFDTMNMLKPFLDKHLLYYCFVLLGFASVGSILQIAGGNWDVTSHLLLKPETFFTPSHTIMYGGILLLSISALIAACVLYKYKQIKHDPISLSFKFLIIGSVLSIVSGPSDFVWHEVFGVDGFLSPTHLMLITGMLINTIGTVLGLTRLNSLQKDRSFYIVNRMFLVIALIALWLNLISYVYIFSLPISSGDVFNFNLHPVLESLIALIFLPLINAFMILFTTNTIKNFGYISLVGIGVIIITSISNILPSEELSIFLPYYLLSVIPFILIDLVVYDKLPFTEGKSRSKNKILFATVISASLFYVIGYPMLPLALGNYLMPLNLSDMEFSTLVDIIPVFENSFSIVFPLTLTIGVLVGLGSGLIYERIQKYIKNKIETRFKIHD